MYFHKYQSLGNCYAIVSQDEWGNRSIDSIPILSNPRLGIGFDGLIIGPWTDDDFYKIRIFNSDSSECSLSGNALRIFAYHLKNKTDFFQSSKKVKILKSDVVSSFFFEENGNIQVSIGSYNEDFSKFMDCKESITFKKEFYFDSKRYMTYGINLANPHIVVLGIPQGGVESISKLGSIIGTDKCLLDKSNVHFSKLLSRKKIFVESWERGAGYTLSSSNGAAAVVALYHSWGQVDNIVTVDMPGGSLIVEIGKSNSLLLTGTVEIILEGLYCGN